MYHLLGERRVSSILVREAPAFLAALLVAELFFKFHSFTLECLAFLGCWYAFSRLLNAKTQRG